MKYNLIELRKWSMEYYHSVLILQATILQYELYSILYLKLSFSSSMLDEKYWNSVKKTFLGDRTLTYVLILRD